MSRSANMNKCILGKKHYLESIYAARAGSQYISLIQSLLRGNDILIEC